MPVIRILPHPEYCPDGAEIKASAGTSLTLERPACVPTLERGNDQCQPDGLFFRDFSRGCAIAGMARSYGPWGDRRG